mmetsp:Transcript_4265/g.11323  ORF Transcript_4265/g.11323 Transcript_4265/m.11323 type:complete len:325 (-) Transcript_4265:315-1289(-)
MLLDDRVLDVRPEARVGEVGAPLGDEVVARAVGGGLGALVHEVGDVAPRKLGDAELETRRRHEEHLPVVGADRHDHVEVLEGEGGRRVDDRLDLVRLDEEAVVLDKVRLLALLEVVAAVEGAPQRVVVVDGHAEGRTVLHEPQVALRRVRRQRAVHLRLIQHRRREEVVGLGLGRLAVLESAQQLAAEKGVEGVAVVVEEHRVLRLDVRDRVHPPLHRRRAQRQRQHRDLVPPLEDVAQVNLRARLKVGVRVDEVHAGRRERLERADEAGRLRARVLHRHHDRHLLGHHLGRALRVRRLRHGRNRRRDAVAGDHDHRNEQPHLI